MNKIKKSIDIAFAINDNFVNPLNIAIFSILKNNPNNHFNIYVMYSKLSKKNQKEITRIKNFFDNIKINFIDVSILDRNFDNLKLNMSHITRETYFRYVLPEAISDRDLILYLDADILINGSIEKLWSINIDNFWAAGVDEPDVKVRFPLYKESIGFERDELFINAGVILMNLKKIRQDNMVSKLFSNTVKFEQKILFQDQDIINITFKKGIKEVSHIYNYTDQYKLDEKSRISDIIVIHYNGLEKPWNNIKIQNWQKPFLKLYRQYVDEYNELIYKDRTKFALYRYTTENIGDEIQSIAARRFLPRVDYYIDRDRVGEWKNYYSKEKVKLIANAWYSHYPHLWPNTDKTLDIAYESMYIEQDFSEVVKKVLSKKSRDNFYKYGKIGARDKNTLNFFKDNNIDAYFSGCLTLTLQRDERIEKQDFILMTDTTYDLYKYVDSNTDKKVIYLTNTGDYSLSTDEKMRKAELFLYLYQSASCVITSRLHTALPCLALNTPVCLLNTHKTIDNKRSRFAGLDNLVNFFTEDNIIEGNYNFNNPPNNPEGYLKIRNRLIRKMSNFTNFNNLETAFWTDIPELKIDDVISEITYFQNKGLNDISISSREKESLNNTLELQNSNLKMEIYSLSRELLRLEEENRSFLSLKRSIKLTAGNIKRYIKKSLRVNN